MFPLDKWLTISVLIRFRYVETSSSCQMCKYPQYIVGELFICVFRLSILILIRWTLQSGSIWYGGERCIEEAISDDVLREFFSVETTHTENSSGRYSAVLIQIIIILQQSISFYFHNLKSDIIKLNIYCKIGYVTYDMVPLYFR